MNETCKTCMYGNIAADGIGYYCSHPKKLAIQCVRHNNKYYIARIEDAAFEQLLATKQPRMICDVCETEEPIPEGKTHPEGWLDIKFKDVNYSKIHLCKQCTRLVVLNYTANAASTSGIRPVHLTLMQKYFPNFHELDDENVK